MIKLEKGVVSKVMLMTPKYTLFKKDVRRCVTPLGLSNLKPLVLVAKFNREYNNENTRKRRFEYGKY